MQFPIADIRAQFPALSTKDRDRPRIYFDAPGGTQVCSAAIDRMCGHLRRGTANDGGAFQSSKDTQELIDAAHAAMADFLGGHPDEIAFGANMTSLTLSVSRALAQEWDAGDELVVTRLDHDANIAPWLLVARDRGMTVRWLDFDPGTGRLELGALPHLLGPRTRLVAVGGASNALGTLNDVAEVCRIVRLHSKALVFVDAVQRSPMSSQMCKRWAATCSYARLTNFLALTREFCGHNVHLWSASTRTKSGQRPMSRPQPSWRLELSHLKLKQGCSGRSNIWSGCQDGWANPTARVGIG